ncbi:MAG: porin family protein [Balneolaceae bacterium]|nr:porin family protein [Balneolaceae bacterium]
MKKVTAITLFLFAFSVFIYPDVAMAQNSVKFGFKGGVTVSNYLDIDPDPDSRIGTVFGGFAEINLESLPIAIQPEVIWIQRGAEVEGQGQAAFDSKVNVNYLDIDVLAKYKFDTNSPLKPNIFVGPYLGIDLNQATREAVEVVGSFQPEAKTDFGGVVGLGTDIEVLGATFIIDARWNVGLSDAFDNASGKNSVFSFMGGIAF